MYLLGIETSCDETAAAVLTGDDTHIEVVTEEIASQNSIHELYGGVVPELASRAHLAHLPVMVQSVLQNAGVTLEEISCIAVTRGPGLKGCLLMGLNFARGLSLVHSIPLIGVNHIEGHILSTLLDNSELSFPFLSLVVSGGHTELHRVDGVSRYSLISRTSDDAAGEAFDKAANLLGFSYPGGAALSALADTVTSSPFKLPKIMREAEGFSFSGLKTAILLLVRENQQALTENELVRAQIAFTVQDAIIDALIFKLKQAIDREGASNVSVSGGVSANAMLRKRLAALQGVNVYLPSAVHCMDNAAMIAHVGWHRFLRGERLSAASGVLDRWPVEQVSLLESDGVRR